MDNNRRFLLYLCRCVLNEIRPAYDFQNIDYNELYKIAYRNKISCTVGSLIASDLNCPQDIKDKFNADEIKSAHAETLQKAQTDEILQAASSENIKLLPLKGYILKNCYPKPYLRYMTDVDLFVFSENAERAGELLINAGFRITGHDYVHTVFKKKPCLVFELHTDFVDNNVDKRGYFADFAKRAAADDGNSLSMSNEDFYIYMTAHAAGHFISGGCGIRTVIDFYVFNKSHDALDREYIAAELKKCGLYEFENNMLKLSQIWFSEHEQDEFSDLLGDFIINSGAFGRPENISLSRALTENRKFSLFEKFRQLFKIIFPNKQYMNMYYAWSAKSLFLLPFAYLLRVLVKLFRFKRNSKRVRSITSVKECDFNKIKEIYNKMGFFT